MENYDILWNKLGVVKTTSSCIDGTTKLKNKIKIFQRMFAKKSQVVTLRLTLNTTAQLLLFSSSQARATETIKLWKSVKAV